MNKRLFTLLEVLLVTVILGLVASAALLVVDQSDDQMRLNENKRRIEQIRRAILGPDGVVINGQPLLSGYLADVGEMPKSINNLLQQPNNIPTWDLSDTLGFSSGWRGPYISTFDTATNEDTSEQEPVFKDAWGEDWEETPNVNDYLIKITSYGKDRLPDDEDSKIPDHFEKDSDLNLHSAKTSTNSPTFNITLTNSTGDGGGDGGANNDNIVLSDANSSVTYIINDSYNYIHIEFWEADDEYKATDNADYIRIDATADNNLKHIHGKKGDDIIYIHGWNDSEGGEIQGDEGSNKILINEAIFDKFKDGDKIVLKNGVEIKIYEFEEDPIVISGFTGVSNGGNSGGSSGGARDIDLQLMILYPHANLPAAITETWNADTLKPFLSNTITVSIDDSGAITTAMPLSFTLSEVLTSTKVRLLLVEAAQSGTTIEDKIICNSNLIQSLIVLHENIVTPSLNMSIVK